MDLNWREKETKKDMDLLTVYMIRSRYLQIKNYKQIVR